MLQLKAVMATLSAKYHHTPSLKRSRIEQVHTRLTSSLATTRRFSPTRSQNALESASTLSLIQIAPPLKEDCTAMHTLLDQLYKEDDLLSTKLKEKRSYSHRYEQQQPRGQILVDKLSPIPKIVRDTYQKAQVELGDGRVNFLQGLLEQSGFIYYAVERTVFFFDLNSNFDEEDKGYELELPERPLSALFGIQQLRIGKPYLSFSKEVLLFFQPYEAEIFEFEVRQGSKHRKLELIGVETRLPLPRKRVESLILTKEEGLLYCPDQNGNLCIIQPQSILPWTKKELSIKKLPESLKALWKGTAKQLTSSLRHFGKAIRNYTSSLFSEKQISARCFYDPHRKLIFVLVGNFSYEIQIYQQESGKMSGRLVNDEFLGKGNTDTILAAIAIDPSLNSQYNAVLYLSSGRRLYLDLTADSIRRTHTVKPPNLQSKSEKFDTQRLAILKESYSVHLSYSERRWNCCLTEDMGSNKPEKMHLMELDLSGGPRDYDYQLLHREREKLGPGKKSLLCQNSQISISHEWIRQIFFYTQEFVLTSDQSYQRVRFLRPIDVFYSLLVGLSHSAQVLAALPLAFADVSPIQMVSLCTQLLTDHEGRYILSPSIVYFYRKALGLPSSLKFVQEEADFFSIDKDQRKKVLDLIILLSCEKDIYNRAQKEKMVAEGIMTYIARLFKGILAAQISKITCDCSRVAINNLIEIRGLIQKLNLLFKGEGGGTALKQVQVWIQRARQLLMVISTLPTLPIKTFAEAMSADPSIFHCYLFAFLTKNCQKPITEELSQALPIYCSPFFVRMYRLYNQIRVIKDPTVIVNICTQHLPLPEYLIDYLRNNKKIYELRNQESKQKKIDKEDPQSLVKLAAGYQTKLQEKEMLLERALQILKKERSNKEDQQEIDQLCQRIAEMKSKIKMQILLRNAYTQHEYLRTSRLTQRLSGFIRNTKAQSKQNQVITNLERSLFDADKLSEFASNLALPELKAAYTAIFQLSDLPSILTSLAEQTKEKHKGSPKQLIQQYKKFINFLIVNSRIYIPVEQLLSVYVEIMMNWDVVHQQMQKSDGILEQWIWWPFWWFAQIGQPAATIYQWIKTKLEEFALRNEEGDQIKRIYLKAGFYYLVREYLPSHRSQIAQIMEVDTQHPLMMKVNILLLQLNP